METNHQAVTGTLRVEIMDDGDTEQTITHFKGDFFTKKNMHVITFQEENEEGYAIKTLITIQDEKVSINRTGDIAMHQQFRLNRTTENVYKHPHVNIHMETYTHKLAYLPLTSSRMGQLAITYLVKLNGEDERNHQLTLTIKEDSK